MSGGLSADQTGPEKDAREYRTSPVAVFSKVRCTLGEGPAWDPDLQSLYWVDIRGGTVFAANRDNDIERVWDVPLQSSAVIRMRTGDLLVPSAQEVLCLSPKSGDLRHVAKLMGEPQNNRCNDAKCDPFGNLWIGTMDNGEQDSAGRLWRFSASGENKIVLDGIGVANTLAWDLTRGRFYFADSMVGDIYVFDYNLTSFEIGNRSVFFPRDRALGVPDGSAIDNEGYLWNARWGGSCVVRISPDGQLDRVIELPARRPTSCAFGGSDMKTLFVTSAAMDSPALPDRDDYSGAVFSIDVEVAGSQIPPYAGPVGASPNNRNDL